MRGAHSGTGAGTSHAAPEGFKIFESNEFGQVPVVAREDGEPWFVAKDVCEVLGLTNSRKALRLLDEYEKADVAINDTSQKRLFSIINVSSLYHLTITSRKPFAKRFRKWLTAEVAPDIRRHCVYATGNFVEQTETLDPVPTPEGFKLFESEEFGQVRVVTGPDGEPWFVAADVAEVLGYRDTDDAIRNHCKSAQK